MLSNPAFLFPLHLEPGWLMVPEMLGEGCGVQSLSVQHWQHPSPWCWDLQAGSLSHQEFSPPSSQCVQCSIPWGITCLLEQTGPVGTHFWEQLPASRCSESLICSVYLLGDFFLAAGWALCPFWCAGLCPATFLFEAEMRPWPREVLSGSCKEKISALIHIQRNVERWQKFVLSWLLLAEKAGKEMGLKAEKYSGRTFRN